MPAMGPPPPSLGGLVFVLIVLALFAAIPLLIAGAVIWVVFVYLKVTMVQFLAVGDFDPSWSVATPTKCFLR